MLLLRPKCFFCRRRDDEGRNPVFVKHVRVQGKLRNICKRCQTSTGYGRGLVR